MAPDILGVQRCLLFLQGTHICGAQGVVLLLCQHLPEVPRESGLGGKSLIDGIWVAWEAVLLIWLCHSPGIYLNISSLLSKALLHFSDANLKAEAAEVALHWLKWVVLVSHQYKL